MQTQAQTLAAIRALGLAARVTPHGEYRVAPRLDSIAAERREAIALQEGIAYYTEDAEDAIATARAMVGARVH